MTARHDREDFYADLGFRLRQIRSLNRMSQEALGERLGLTKQTIQRYETGDIHMPSHLIARCALIFDTSIAYFYGEMDRQAPGRDDNRVGLMVAAEIMELPDDAIRKSVFHLVRSINRTWDERERRGRPEDEAA